MALASEEGLLQKEVKPEILKESEAQPRRQDWWHISARSACYGMK